MKFGLKSLQLKIWFMMALAVPLTMFIWLRAFAHMITIGGQACLFDYFGDGSVATFSAIFGVVLSGCFSSICCVFIKSSNKQTKIFNIIIFMLITLLLSSESFDKAKIFGAILKTVSHFCTTSFPAPAPVDGFYTHYDQLVAIRPHTSVEFTTERGMLKVIAGYGILREIELGDHKRQIEVDSLYHYNGFIRDVPPCSKWPGKEDWSGDNGLPQCKYEESVEDTESVADFNRLVVNGFEPYFDMIHTADGLYLGWYLSEEPPRRLYVMVRQYLIKGKKPINIPGACGDKVKISNVR